MCRAHQRQSVPPLRPHPGGRKPVFSVRQLHRKKPHVLLVVKEVTWQLMPGDVAVCRRDRCILRRTGRHGGNLGRSGWNLLSMGGMRRGKSSQTENAHGKETRQKAPADHWLIQSPVLETIWTGISDFNFISAQNHAAAAPLLSISSLSRQNPLVGIAPPDDVLPWPPLFWPSSKWPLGLEQLSLVGLRPGSTRGHRWPTCPKSVPLTRSSLAFRRGSLLVYEYVRYPRRPHGVAAEEC